MLIRERHICQSTDLLSRYIFALSKYRAITLKVTRRVKVNAKQPVIDKLGLRHCFVRGGYLLAELIKNNFPRAILLVAFAVAIFLNCIISVGENLADLKHLRTPAGIPVGHRAIKVLRKEVSHFGPKSGSRRADSGVVMQASTSDLSSIAPGVLNEEGNGALAIRIAMVAMRSGGKPLRAGFLLTEAAYDISLVPVLDLSKNSPAVRFNELFASDVKINGSDLVGAGFVREVVEDVNRFGVFVGNGVRERNIIAGSLFSEFVKTLADFLSLICVNSKIIIVTSLGFTFSPERDIIYKHSRTQPALRPAKLSSGRG